MRTGIIAILTLLIAVYGTWANVGDVLKVIETPGPCPKGLTFDGKHLWLADAFTDKNIRD